MNTENTNDLKEFFSNENLNFFKNLNQELLKIETLLEKNQAKEEKYSLFLATLTSKDFSNTNKEYFVEVKNIYSLLEKNTDILKDLKSTLSSLSAKLLSLAFSADDNQTQNIVSDINKSINHYIELLDDLGKIFVQNNTTINTFTYYHSTKLLLTTFGMELGNDLDESLNLIYPNATDGTIETSYSDILTSTENKVLIISEKENKVYLPYKKAELNEFMAQYPTSYFSYKNVIEKEFIRPLNYFMANQNFARFRETYALYRDREASTTFEALKKAISLTFKTNLNPAIIAACKTKKQLNDYLLCLDENKLDEFSDFKIIYDINPQNV